MQTSILSFLCRAAALVLLAGAQSAKAGPAFSEFVDPNPSSANGFGATIVALSTGNVVITSPGANIGASQTGAVYLFNGATGALISTLRGTTAGDSVGNFGVTALTNGNYVVRSLSWDNGAIDRAGAVTFCNGVTGINGPVTVANSLVGSSASDQVGQTGVVALTNGNYVVGSLTWKNGALNGAGAVTWGSGTTGVSGPVSAANSLVGTSAIDNLGLNGIVALTNGNYVVCSRQWDNGAVADVGAVTWGNGTTGTVGPVSAANSVIGPTVSDGVGSGGAVALTNGNYVVSSPIVDIGAVDAAGAVTWGNGATGTFGVVSAANSLVGSTTSDAVGSGGPGVGSVTPLTNGNYVVGSPSWRNVAANSAGAATWCNGATGRVGVVSAANSIVGSKPNDEVGGSGIVALSNGNYVVRVPRWDNGAVVDAGAATWGNGATGTSGAVSATNSLVGTSTSDLVSTNGVFALNNGNYVVSQSTWDNGALVDVGASTWCNGATGRVGPVTAANSLTGTVASDQVGSHGVFALTNGNYVVCSPICDNGATDRAGAVTWGNGATGIAGPATISNSLVGSTAVDLAGFRGVMALANGNYVVRTRDWDNGAINSAGAVTWGNGTTGSSGLITASNSLVGTSINDRVGDNHNVTGSRSVFALPNGNYVVVSDLWNNSNAAVTFGNGTTGISGPISAANSQVGTAFGTDPRAPVVDAVNGHFIVGWVGERKVRLGSLVDGFAVNNAPTNITLSNATIAENNPVNATIGALAAVDADAGQTHTFAFAGGVDDGAFTITGSTLTINGRSDFETKSSYTVRIRATDNGGPAASFEKNFTITIADADETPGVVAWDDFLRPQDSGAGWTSNWTVAPSIGVNLAYPGLNSGGYAAGGPVNFPGSLRDLPAQTTGVVYLSALISGTSYANVTLYNGASELLGFGIVYSGTGPATQYGAFDNTRNLRSYSTVNVNGDRHLIVIRVDLDANTFAGWVDPNLAAPLGAPAFSSSTTFATGYDFNRLRLEIGAGSQVDELRVVRWNPELLETQTTSPAVSAPVAFGLTDSAASLSATAAGGGLPITQVGVVYAPTSVDADPNPGDAGVLQVSGAAFPVGVAGLSPGVSYSFKAYATNANGTTFTGAATFTTAIPAVIAWDDFLRQQDSGAGWTSNWTGALAGIGANLVYPGLNSGGYAAAGPVGFPGALRDLPPQTTGVVFLSALVSGTSYANVTLYNGFSEIIGFGIVWSGTGPATQYGVYDNTRAVRSYSTVNVDGGTHLVVVRVDLDANTLSGWVDPDLAAPLGAPAFSSSTTFATGYDFTRVRLELGPGSQIDELRVVRANPELLETQVTSPAISGQTATGILLTGATLGGNVTQDGALPIIERGFVISATTVNGNPIVGGVGVTTLPTTGTTGLYSLGVTSLVQGVSYSFKGYATNAIGTTYTAVGIFNTLANAAPTDITLSNASIAENNIAGAIIGTFTATDADGGDTHTFTFAGGADDGAFTITGSTLTINGSADFEAKSSYTVRIRATDSGAENLALEKNLIVSITDVTIPQTITVGALSGKIFGEGAFTVSAIGGASGQSVVFSIFSGPATILGNTVTITGAGLVTVRASQAGSGDYSAAVDVDQSFLVAKATQSITFTPPASAYQPQTITLTATGGGSENAVTFSVVSGPGSIFDGIFLNFTGAGDVIVRASQAGNANYLAATNVEATIAVLPAGPPAVDDAVTMTSGPSVLYPLANDGAPEANILSVSNSDVGIDGRALIVPEGTTGTFTYTNDQGRTATVTVNTITANVAPQRFSGLLYNSTGVIVGRAVTNRTAAGINTFSAQIGSGTGKSVFTFPASGNSAMGIATELGSVSATLGENGHLLVTMTGGITGDLRPSALSPTPAVYNVGLAAVTTSLKGGGFGTVRIGSGGAGKILVKMPDGRAFSAATEMADNGSVTFYGRQAATTPFGYVGGELIFADLAKTDLTGELEWKRPAQFSRVDRAAVNTVVVANGCITNGTFGIPDGAATMTFSGGNYAAPAAYTVNVSGGAVPPFLPTLRFWTPIAPSQTFKFRFLQPGRTIDSTGTGMYFQKSQTALGYFPGLLLSGKVELKQP